MGIEHTKYTEDSMRCLLDLLASEKFVNDIGLKEAPFIRWKRSSPDSEIGAASKLKTPICWRPYLDDGLEYAIDLKNINIDKHFYSLHAQDIALCYKISKYTKHHKDDICTARYMLNEKGLRLWKQNFSDFVFSSQDINSHLLTIVARDILMWNKVKGSF